MKRILLGLLLVSSPAAAEERWVWVQYQDQRAPEFIGSYPTRALCDAARDAVIAEWDGKFSDAAARVLAHGESIAGLREERSTWMARQAALTREVIPLLLGRNGNPADRRRVLAEIEAMEAEQRSQSWFIADEQLRVASRDHELAATTLRSIRRSSLCERR